MTSLCVVHYLAGRKTGIRIGNCLRPGSLDRSAYVVIGSLSASR